jgi:hypothetical protein
MLSTANSLEEWLREKQFDYSRKGGDYSSNYFYVSGGDDKAFTIRVSDHAPGVDESGQVRGGYSVGSGEYHDAADYSIHPGGSTLAQVKKILEKYKPDLDKDRRVKDLASRAEYQAGELGNSQSVERDKDRFHEFERVDWAKRGKKAEKKLKEIAKELRKLVGAEETDRIMEKAAKSYKWGEVVMPVGVKKWNPVIGGNTGKLGVFKKRIDHYRIYGETYGIDHDSYNLGPFRTKAEANKELKKLEKGYPDRKFYVMPQYNNPESKNPFGIPVTKREKATARLKEGRKFIPAKDKKSAEAMARVIGKGAKAERKGLPLVGQWGVHENPIPKLTTSASPYAPMGRHSYDSGDPVGTIYISHVPITDGYDPGGHYWGTGTPLWMIGDQGDTIREYTRQPGKKQVLEYVKSRWPDFAGPVKFIPAVTKAARKTNPVVHGNRVTFSKKYVEDFKRRWPASGLPSKSLWFEMDHEGNLVDIGPGDTEKFDGPALLALSEDAKEIWMRSRSKKNPADSADSMYQSFHGEPSTEILEIAEDEHYHQNLAALGTLVELRIVTPANKQFNIQFPGAADVQLENNPVLWPWVGKDWVPYKTFAKELPAQKKFYELDGNGVKVRLDRVRTRLLPTPQYKWELLVHRSSMRDLFGKKENPTKKYLVNYATTYSHFPESYFTDDLKLAEKWFRNTQGPLHRFSVLYEIDKNGNYQVLKEWKYGQPAKNPAAKQSDTVYLCSNEEGTQMYIVGGDQSVDLQALGITGKAAEKDLVTLGELTHVTYHTRKVFNGKPEEYDYIHKLSEDTKGPLPVVIYDTRNQKLSISGGSYYIDKPLLGTSPGLED